MEFSFDDYECDEKESSFDEEESDADGGNDDNSKVHEEESGTSIPAVGNNVDPGVRCEPGISVSEFNLRGMADTRVNLSSLLKPLKSKLPSDTLCDRIQVSGSRRAPLNVPLNKTETHKIQRSVGYSVAQAELSKWDGIVRRFRVSEVSFPLKKPKLNMEMTDGVISDFQPRTSLEMKLAEALGQTKKNNDNKEMSEFEKTVLRSMSLKEALEKRREISKIRALQSYREAKERRMKKVKSKKYHRILKKERIRKELKDFEELRKNNPELALEKLDEIERRRIEERMSLRHKNTGKWAKMTAIRAKYDKTAQEALRDQIAISRELTQKTKALESSDEEDKEKNDDATEDVLTSKSNNPWVNSVEQKLTVGYRKYWSEQQKQNNETEQEVKVSAGSAAEVSPGYVHLDSSQKGKAKKSTGKSKASLEKARPGEWNSTRPKQLVKKKRPKIQTDEDRYEIDSVTQSTETANREGQSMEDEADVVMGSAVADIRSKDVPHSGPVQIDPDDFIKADPIHLQSTVSDAANEMLDDAVDDDSDDEQRITMEEAFADDDVIAEFRREKRDDVDASTPKDIDLTLPGWGEWGGSGVVPKKTKVIKAARPLSRRDHLLGNVIISETAKKPLSKHQVSDIPFPYKTIDAFESSIRAPIGSTWIPETAFNKLIKPKVVTKLGTVIKPIDVEDLVIEKSKKDFSEEISHMPKRLKKYRNELKTETNEVRSNAKKRNTNKSKRPLHRKTFKKNGPRKQTIKLS